MESSDMKNSGTFALYVDFIETPAIQVLLLGTGFLYWAEPRFTRCALAE